MYNLPITHNSSEILRGAAAQYIDIVEDEWREKRTEWMEWNNMSKHKNTVYAHESFRNYVSRTGDNMKITKQAPYMLPEIDDISCVESNTNVSISDDVSEKKNKLVDFYAMQQKKRTSGYLIKFLNKYQPPIKPSNINEPIAQNKGLSSVHIKIAAKHGRDNKLSDNQKKRMPEPSKANNFLHSQSSHRNSTSLIKRNLTPVSKLSTVQRKPLLSTRDRLHSSQKDVKSFSSGNLMGKLGTLNKIPKNTSKPLHGSLAKTNASKPSAIQLKSKSFSSKQITSRIDTGLRIKSIRGGGERTGSAQANTIGNGEPKPRTSMYSEFNSSDLKTSEKETPPNVRLIQSEARTEKIVEKDNLTSTAPCEKQPLVSETFYPLSRGTRACFDENQNTTFEIDDFPGEEEEKMSPANSVGVSEIPSLDTSIHNATNSNSKEQGRHEDFQRETTYQARDPSFEAPRRVNNVFKFDFIQEEALNYLRTLELEWKCRRDAWLEGNKYSASKHSVYECETFSEYIRMAEKTLYTMPLQIPFTFPNLEEEPGNPILTERTSPSAEISSSENSSSNVDTKSIAVGTSEIRTKPAHDYADLRPRTRHFPQNENDSLNDIFTEYGSKEPVRVQVLRKVTISRYDYKENMSRDSPLDVFEKASSEIFDEVNRIVDMQESSNSDKNMEDDNDRVDFIMRKYAKKYVHYLEEDWKSQSDDSKESIHKDSCMTQQGRTLNDAMGQQINWNQVPFQLQSPEVNTSSNHNNMRSPVIFSGSLESNS